MLARLCMPVGFLNLGLSLTRDKLTITTKVILVIELQDNNNNDDKKLKEHWL